MKFKILLVVIVIALVGGAFWWFFNNSNNNLNNEAINLSVEQENVESNANSIELEKPPFIK